MAIFYSSAAPRPVDEPALKRPRTTGPAVHFKAMQLSWTSLALVGIDNHGRVSAVLGVPRVRGTLCLCGVWSLLQGEACGLRGLRKRWGPLGWLLTCWVLAPPPPPRPFPHMRGRCPVLASWLSEEPGHGLSGGQVPLTPTLILAYTHLHVFTHLHTHAFAPSSPGSSYRAAHLHGSALSILGGRGTDGFGMVGRTMRPPGRLGGLATPQAHPWWEGLHSCHLDRLWLCNPPM